MKRFGGNIPNWIKVISIVMAIGVAFIGGGIASAAVPADAKATADAAQSYISKESAENTALDDAVVGRSETTYIYSHFDWDDGVPTYDVEFVCDGVEYEYEIHAVDGSIRDRSQEQADGVFRSGNKYSTEVVQTDPSEANTTQSQSQSSSNSSGTAAPAYGYYDDDWDDRDDYDDRDDDWDDRDDYDDRDDDYDDRDYDDNDDDDDDHDDD